MHLPRGQAAHGHASTELRAVVQPPGHHALRLEVSYGRTLPAGAATRQGDEPRITQAFFTQALHGQIPVSSAAPLAGLSLEPRPCTERAASLLTTPPPGLTCQLKAAPQHLFPGRRAGAAAPLGVRPGRAWQSVHLGHCCLGPRRRALSACAGLAGPPQPRTDPEALTAEEMNSLAVPGAGAAGMQVSLAEA